MDAVDGVDSVDGAGVYAAVSVYGVYGVYGVLPPWTASVVQINSPDLVRAVVQSRDNAVGCHLGQQASCR